jgi:hypothetical protein
MNTQRLYEILQKTTRVYRKGEQIEQKIVGNVHVTEIYGYPHTSEAKENGYEKVDMIFVDVLVDRQKAAKIKNELEEILADYPQPERLAGGPSYIELAPNIGLEQEGALRTMALGKALGLWEVMSAKTLGMDEQTAREMAGAGFLMISGYKTETGGKK